MTKKFTQYVLFCILASWSVLSFAETEITIDPATSEIQTNPEQIITAPKSPEPEVIVPYTIQIESPLDQATFQNADQSITVVVNVSPELKAQDKVVILVDNVEVAESLGSPSVSLPWLARGEHSLQAKVIPAKGVAAESESIIIYQQRTSALLKAH